MYRPKDWVELKRKNCMTLSGHYEKRACEVSFEAGADAMLEELMKDSEHLDAYQGYEGAPHKAGWLVFIPDFQ